MYRLEKQAYKAQADFLGQSYRAGMPFQSHNMWNALNTDLLYGAGALGAGGTLWYLNSEDSK